MVLIETSTGTVEHRLCRYRERKFRAVGATRRR